MLEKTINSLLPDQPVLVVDADEVLLQFVTSLEHFFPSKGFELHLNSFRLQGNIFHRGSKDVADTATVKLLLEEFFDECVDTIPAVDGAADALHSLSKHFQVLILTNIPEHCRARREQSLKQLGMTYPVIANEGEKGPVVKKISTLSRCPTAFIDDLPPHHTSVAKHSPSTHRIHFIADNRLSKLAPHATDAHSRCYSWPEITKYLLKLEGVYHAREH